MGKAITANPHHLVRKSETEEGRGTFHSKVQMVRLLLKGLGIPPLTPLGSLPFLTLLPHVGSESEKR